MKQPQFPNEWSLVQIEDILAMQEDGKIIHQGWSPQCEREPASENEWGVLKTTAIQDGFFLDNEHKKLPETKTPKPRLEVKAGDLLVTNAGPRSRCGIICLVKHTRNKLMISGKMYRLRLPEKFIIPNFIEAWLRTSFTQNELNNRKTGISESGLNMTQSRFSTLPVPLASFSEQKIIAEKLDTLLAQVDSTKARLEQIPQILKFFRQAVLISAVNGRLTKEYHPNGIFGVQTSLGELISNGPQNGLYKSSKFYGEGVKIIRIDSFYDGKILSLDKLKKVDISTDEKNRWQLHENDILINRVNSIEYLGKCAHVKMLSEDVVFESNIMRFSIDTTMISPEYLTLFLCSAAGIKELRKNAKLAVNQASINQTDVKNCKLTLPTLTEQAEIVRRVEQLFAYADTIEKQVNSALTRVNRLTQSILSKAFRGELTAQWRAENPDLISGENSAAALLEKIKAERAASSGKKTARRKS